MPWVGRYGETIRRDKARMQRGDLHLERQQGLLCREQNAERGAENDKRISCRGQEVLHAERGIGEDNRTFMKRKTKGQPHPLPPKQVNPVLLFQGLIISYLDFTLSLATPHMHFTTQKVTLRALPWPRVPT